MSKNLNKKIYGKINYSGFFRNEIFVRPLYAFDSLFSLQGRMGILRYFFGFIINIVVAGLFSLNFMLMMHFLENPDIITAFIGAIFAILACLFLFLDGILFFSATIRRLHDLGFSGWWILLLPATGGLFLIILLLVSGNNHDNKYGPITIYE